jgi:hypothetical protein
MNPLFFIAFLAATAIAQDVVGKHAEPAAAKGNAFLQILNGVAPRPVSFSWEGGPVYEKIGPGTRISAMPVRAGDFSLKVRDEQTGAEKVFKLRIEPKTSNTLFLIGDFAPVQPPAGADQKLVPDFNLTASILKNEKPEGSKVNVNVINGLADKTLEISRARSVLSVRPGEVGVARNLPAELTFKASDGRESVMLYLAQSSNPANLAIVFFEKDGHLAFRATTEEFQ